MKTDEELMHDLAERDQSALENLYNRYSTVLYSAALRVMGDSGAAEEILQDSFFQLWAGASQFDASRGSLIGWLLTIVRHRALSRMRVKHFEVHDESRSIAAILPENAGVSVLEQHIARELVSLAFESLSSVQREAITLAYFEGLTCEEISKRTGEPLGTIKHRMRSGLHKMKSTLTESPRGVNRLLSATLEDILITDLLARRHCRLRGEREEADCQLILRQLRCSPTRLVDAFLEIAMKQCCAGSAGLSFIETNDAGEQVFRWTNLAGVLKRYTGGNTPRNFSPCGVTLDRGCPQLFSYPARYFHYFRDIEVPIVEGLVIPFHVGKAEGTIWIASHVRGRRFDGEDARIMMSLGEFVGCTLHVAKMSINEIGRPQ